MRTPSSVVREREEREKERAHPLHRSESKREGESEKEGERERKSEGKRCRILLLKLFHCFSQWQLYKLTVFLTV